MSSNPARAYVVVRREDGYGDVFPLLEGTRHRLGRAPSNKIVIRDDLCSREHAEIYPEGTDWAIRDLGSLNGTMVNGELLRKERLLRPLDEIRVGRTRLLFVEELGQLPEWTSAIRPKETEGDGLAIRKRLGQTRYLPPAASVAEITPAELRIAPNQALAVLYRLALDMANSATPVELCELVVDALFRATPAETAAVLAVKEDNELAPVVYRCRNPNAPPTYHKVSSFVSREVMTTRQAILAENVATDQTLNTRESIAELRIASLICAPVFFENQILGLLHLYRTTPTVPLNADDLEFTLAVARQFGVVWHRLRREVSLTTENRNLRSQLRLESELIGESPVWQRVLDQAMRAAQTKATVLIRGESGVGKELLARAIHQASPRRHGPFVTLNCAALTETLLESELFGHEKGAFTGATERLIGKFESADEGTIFLDEIGEMSLATQAKFLRVLEGHPFERVGGNVPIHVDVRVVAATNRPLEEAVRAGTFRRDLFFRLQVVQLDVPPLRERREDVPLLAEHFLKRFCRETGRKFKGFTAAALDKLQHYHWPGNVRELKNVIERAVALAPGPVIDASDIWLSQLDLPAIPGTRSSESMHDKLYTPESYQPISLEELEKRHIWATLQHTNWNKSQASAILGIERSTLDRKIKAYGFAREGNT
jgi:Nif-specific regulatory protein